MAGTGQVTIGAEASHSHGSVAHTYPGPPRQRCTPGHGQPRRGEHPVSPGRATARLRGPAEQAEQNSGDRRAGESFNLTYE
jgi:hypothetical protein